MQQQLLASILLPPPLSSLTSYSNSQLLCSLSLHPHPWPELEGSYKQTAIRWELGGVMVGGSGCFSA